MTVSPLFTPLCQALRTNSLRKYRVIDGFYCRSQADLMRASYLYVRFPRFREPLFEKLVHAVADMLSIAQTVLHERDLISRQNIESMRTFGGDAFDLFRTPAEIALVPDAGRERAAS